MRAPRIATVSIGLICTLVSAVAHAEQAPPFDAKVVSVTDGDSFQIMRGGKAERIRLYALDCPELDQPHGKEARQVAQGLLLGKTVRIIPVRRDQYGRLMATVLIEGGVNLNQGLVASGWAWWHRGHGDPELFKQLEASAKAKKKGLWASKNPIAPWRYREGREKNSKARASNAGKAKQAAPAKAAVAPIASSKSPKRSSAKTTAAKSGDSARVFITKTGEKYHREGCRHLRRSKLPRTLADVRAKFAPCTVCKPPI